MKNTAHAHATEAAYLNESSSNDNAISIRRSALLAETDASRLASIWEPVARRTSCIPSSSEVLNARPQQQLRVDNEQKIIATLLRPLAPGETHESGNTHREHELRILFAELSPIEALALRLRLDGDRDDDRLVVAFRRLVMQRRHRLRTFLADPRRCNMKGR